MLGARTAEMHAALPVVSIENATERLRAWQGRKLPYLFGMVDVCLLIALAQHFGVTDATNVKQFSQVASTWVFGANE